MKKNVGAQIIFQTLNYCIKGKGKINRDTIRKTGHWNIGAFIYIKNVDEILLLWFR